MLENNWQPIAIIIAAMIAAVSSFLGPSVAVMVKARIDQPKQTPSTNQPKSRARLGKLWFVSMTCNLFALILMIIMAWRYGNEPVNLRRAIVLAFAASVIMCTFIINAISYRDVRNANA